MRLSLPVLISLSTAAGLVALDSWYFKDFREVVLTPYNFLLYNMSAENLASHGLHPRWLHVTINMPMIISPALWFYVVTAGFRTLRNSLSAKDKTKFNPIYMINLGT